MTLNDFVIQILDDRMAKELMKDPTLFAPHPMSMVEMFLIPAIVMTVNQEYMPTRKQTAHDV